MQMTKAKKTILLMIIPAIVPLLKPQFDGHTPRQHSSPMPHWKSYVQEQADDSRMHLFLQHFLPNPHSYLFTKKQEDELMMHLLSQHCSLVPHWWSYEQ